MSKIENIDSRVRIVKSEHPALHRDLSSLKPRARPRRLVELATIGWALEQGHLQVHSGVLPGKAFPLAQDAIVPVAKEPVVATSTKPTGDGVTEQNYIIPEAIGDDIEKLLADMGSV